MRGKPIFGNQGSARSAWHAERAPDDHHVELTCRWHASVPACGVYRGRSNRSGRPRLFLQTHPQPRDRQHVVPTRKRHCGVLVLYILLSGVLVTLFALRKLPWVSLWPVLLFHCVIRIVAEACGLAFGVSPAQNIRTLIAYYIFARRAITFSSSARLTSSWPGSRPIGGRSWVKTVIASMRSCSLPTL